MSSSPVAVGSVGLPLGSTAIDFQLKGVDGKTHSLKSFSDKKALAIVFSCNHCPYVQAYEARMIQLKTIARAFLSEKLFRECVLPSTPFNWKSMAVLPRGSPTEPTATGDEDIISLVEGRP